MEQEKRDYCGAPRLLKVVWLRRGKINMKWLVCYGKCLDFVLKVLALGLVFGFIELKMSVGHLGTERWAVLTLFLHIFLRITSRGSSEESL